MSLPGYSVSLVLRSGFASCGPGVRFAYVWSSVLQDSEGRGYLR
jgi:hypothetical protein